MDSLFTEIKSRYNDRYIIVDTTPLLPFAEPHYIAKPVGAVILVVREGMTTSDKLKRALDILKNNNLLGVVSNCVTRLTSLQGYYGYYGYQGKSKGTGTRKLLSLTLKAESYELQSES